MGSGIYFLIAVAMLLIILIYLLYIFDMLPQRTKKYPKVNLSASQLAIDKKSFKNYIEQLELNYSNSKTKKCYNYVQLQISHNDKIELTNYKLAINEGRIYFGDISEDIRLSISALGRYDEMKIILLDDLHRTIYHFNKADEYGENLNFCKKAFLILLNNGDDKTDSYKIDYHL